MTFTSDDLDGTARARGDPISALRTIGSDLVMSSFPQGAIIVFDHDLRYLGVGGLGLGDVGLSRQMLEGKTIQEVFSHDVVAAIEPAYRQALAGHESSMDVDYGDRTFLQRLGPVRDHDGDVVAGMGFTQDVTDTRRLEHALLAEQRRLAHAQRIAGLASFEFDAGTGELTWSDGYRELLGLDRATPPTEQVLLSMIHPDDRPMVIRAWRETTTLGKEFEFPLRILRFDGQERWMRAQLVCDETEDGAVLRAMGTLTDETDRVERDRARREAETRFEIGFEQAAIGAAIVDLDGLPSRVNPAMCAFLGDSADRLIGRRWSEYTHPGETPLGSAVFASVAEGRDVYEDERRYIRADGTAVWASTHVTLVRDESGEPQYFYFQLRDITARKEVERDLAFQAMHDGLTGLPNRALLTDRLLHSLAGSLRHGTKIGVIFLDVDHLKLINDSLGHSSGDDLIRAVAARIQHEVRPEDTLARFGGDEFVIVCNDVNATALKEIADRVLDAVSRPYALGSQEMNVTASLGIALSGARATPETLLRDSDTAMYRAKQRGRARVEVFDDELRAQAERRLVTVSALRRALERQELTVHYQPIADLASGKLVSAEALVRWEHPERGFISPAEFIPIAEDTGLIVSIGAWVLEQACDQLVRWHRACPSMSMAVNVSVRQMVAPNFVDQVDDILRRTHMVPDKLCLELTESLFMQDVEHFGKILADLKNLGVLLSIDDFGTGYSSLSYLKEFPFDAVKVDRAFVDGLGREPHDSALVAAIVAMADALDLVVTAEGVETDDQLAHLRRLHCQRAQGYHLARPMPAADMSCLIEAGLRAPFA